MTSSPLGIDREEQLAQVVDEFFDDVAKGKTPEISEYLRRYPEIADKLKVVIPAILAAEHAANRSEPTSFHSIVPQDRQLGDFRILRQIGRGGMGVVYEAEQVCMKRRVALKVLPLAGLVDERKIHRFQNEVRAVAALNHPNIVPVYMVGQERGVHYYAMQLIHGRSLSDVILSLQRVRDHGEPLDGESISQITNIGKSGSGFDARDGAGKVRGPDAARDAQPAACETIAAEGNDSTIPHSSHREYLRSVAALGIQAASALQHAHEQGIVHRDIKPANLLLDSSATLFVTDFGLARMESDVGVTMTGDLLGTLRYMAPEQALAKRVAVDHRADIYSLGVTLYELVALQPAYRAEDRQLLLKQIAFEEPTPLRRLDREIPPELETIIHKAMSKDMDQRYLSASELADDLRAHLDNRPIKAKPPTTSEIISKWTRRNPTLTWAAFITLTLITITLSASMFFISKEWRISEDHRVRATKAEREAKKARDESIVRANELARRNYLLHIANADRALLGKDKDYIRGRAELDVCPIDQRGWEWRFLDQRIQHVFPWSFRGGSEQITRDGGRLMAIKWPSESDDDGNHRIVTWDLNTGKEIDEDKLVHGIPLQQIGLSKDEQWIGGTDKQGHVFVWDAKTGRERWRVDTKGKAYHVAFSPLGHLIACTCGPSIVVFDATNGNEIFTLGPFDNLGGISYSPDGQWMAIGSADGRGPTLLVDAATGKLAETLSAEGNMRTVFDPRGQRIATANVDGSIRIWVWDGEKLEQSMSWLAVGRRAVNPADHQIFNIAFSADGAYLASSDRTNHVRVWNSETGELLATLRNRDASYGLLFRPNVDGKPGQDDQLMMGSATVGIRFWRWRGDEGAIKVKPLDGAVEAKFSPDGKLILASTPMYFTGGSSYYHRHPYYPPESATILSAESGAHVVAIDEAIYDASWSPDGNEIIATPATGDAIRTYDVASGQPTSRKFPNHTGRFTISRCTPSQHHLASFSTDNTLRVFDYKSGEKLLERSIQAAYGKEYGGTTAEFSHDASRIGLGSALIEIQDGAEVRLQDVPGHWMKQMVFSQDGDRVYVGLSGGLLVQYDTHSGKELKRFAGHSGYVRAIAISPEEKYIVAGDTFGQAIVWDVASEQPLVTLTAGDHIISSLDWSGDGRRIVAGKEDGTVQIWTLPITP